MRTEVDGIEEPCPNTDMSNDQEKRSPRARQLASKRRKLVSPCPVAYNDLQIRTEGERFELSVRQ